MVAQHTIERLDAWQVQLPAQVLPVDLAKVRYKKGIFISGLAEFMVDVLHTLAESIADQFLGRWASGVTVVMVMMIMVVVEEDVVDGPLHKHMIVRIFRIIQ